MAPKIRILSLDGGGIRGVIAAVVLFALEERIQKRVDNNARLADYFDLVAGTSTGAILACGLLTPGDDGRPRYTAAELLDIYLEHGEQLFHRSRLKRVRSFGGLRDERFDSDELERLLEDYFGNTWVSELLRESLVTAYDVEDAKATFFRQREARDLPHKDFRVRDVARASSAAPTYFEAVQIRSRARDPSGQLQRKSLVDGGMFANNPALCAYAQAARDQGIRAEDMLLLSVGTGELRERLPYEQVKDWGQVKWVVPLIDILLAAGQNTVHFQLQQLFEAAGAPNQYMRIQWYRDRDDKGAFVPLPFQADLADASQDNVNDLRAAGWELVHSRAADLDAMADRLVAEGPLPQE